MEAHDPTTGARAPSGRRLGARTAGTRTRPARALGTFAVLVGLVVTMLGGTGVPAARAADGDVVITLAQLLQSGAPVGVSINGGAPLTAALDSPTGVAVDVDGNGTNDLRIVADIVATAGQPLHVIVTREPGAPAALPVKVQATLVLAGGAAVVTLGYDALASTAPARFDLGADLVLRNNGSDLELVASTMKPGSSLTVLGSAVTQLDDGDPSTPIVPHRRDARLGLTPVPAGLFAVVSTNSTTGTDSVITGSSAATTAAVSLHDDDGARVLDVNGTVGVPAGFATVTATNDPAGASRRVDVATTSPVANVDVTIDRADISGRTNVHARATNLPSAFGVEVDGPVTDPTAVTYSGSAPLGSLQATVDRFTGSALAHEIVLNATNLPTSLQVTHIGDDAEITANAPVGSVTAGFASGGNVRLLSQSGHYVHAFVTATVDSLAAQLVGLSHATIHAADPFTVDAAIASAPLRVLDVRQSRFGGVALERRIDVTATNAPGSVSLALSLANGHVEYHGSAPIGTITVDARNPLGINGLRATRADVTATTVPTDLALTFASLGQGISFQTGLGQTVGRIDVLLRNNVTPTGTELLGANEQGLLVKDVPARFVVNGRIFGLQTASFQQTDTTASNGNKIRHQNLVVTTDPKQPNRAFRGRFETTAPVGTASEFSQFVLSPLPNAVTVQTTSEATSANKPRETSVSYLASEIANTLTVDSNAGPSVLLHASLHPVPTSLSVCKGELKSECTGDPIITPGSSLKLRANNVVTIDLFDCLAGPANCTAANASRFTNVDGLTLSPTSASGQFAVLELDVDAPLIKGGDVGHVWVDTNNSEINGDFESITDPDPAETCTTNPSHTLAHFDDVRAQNRLVRLTVDNLPLFPCSATGVSVVNESGTMNCGPGTTIDAKPEIGLGAGELKQELCTVGF